MAAANLVVLTGIRATAHDLLGDVVADHTDTDAIERLIIEGVAAGPPIIAPEAVGGHA